MSRPPPRIAVVDDEPSVRRAFARLLASAGWQVDVHADGYQFLAAVRERRPDVVLLDLRMPGLTGLDVQTHLARLGIELPVVFVTSHDEPEFRSRALEAGARDVLRKPVGDEALIETIRKVLPGSEPERRRSNAA